MERFFCIHRRKWVNKHTYSIYMQQIVYGPCPAHAHEPKQEVRRCFSLLLKAALGFKLTKSTVPHSDAEEEEENRQEGCRGINKTAGNV